MNTINQVSRIEHSVHIEKMKVCAFSGDNPGDAIVGDASNGFEAGAIGSQNQTRNDHLCVRAVIAYFCEQIVQQTCICAAVRPWVASFVPMCTE